MTTLNLKPLSANAEGHSSEHDHSSSSARELLPVVARELASAPDRARNIRREITDDQICVLTFDRPDSCANVFDRATMSELNEHLDFIVGQPRLRGVVLVSDKPAIFIAGADLHALASLPPVELHSLIDFGQATFNRLAALAVPTVAAIHGACVGGGYELCLACDYRVASPERATQIGLPETQLGILPAWGGSTRLPRLIGLPQALELILAGKILAAKPALKRGLVDALVPREKLVEFACQKINAEGLSLRRHPRSFKMALTNNAFVAALISARLTGQLLKKTRGHYPAVLKSLAVASQGVSRPLADSLKLEAEAVLELAPTETCRNLVRVFFLQERAKKLLPAIANPATDHPVPDRPITRTAVIGAGVMGAGIAQWLSAHGLPVMLRDLNTEQVGKGMATIARLYAEDVQRRRLTPLEARTGRDRIFPATNEAPLNACDLVIEAAVEKMDLKKQIFRRLAELAGPDTVLATNTSALSISEIAAATHGPERVVGIHFFNPVHRMQLVEIVAGRQTSPEVVRRALRFAQQIGKLPVLVHDSPGFLVNRILMPYLLEAGHLFEGGARVEDLDAAMLEFGMPMGPLRLIDEVGVDVAQHVARTLADKFGDRMRVPQVLEQMLAVGLFGRKNERGFYLYQARTPEVNRGLRVFRQNDSAAGLSREELQKRLVLLMVNEAVRCLEEGVVAAPEDVDFGMIMGTGFAPFRGGPLRYADALGAATVVGAMNRLAAAGALHFKPCALLASQAAAGATFYHEKGDRL